MGIFGKKRTKNLEKPQFNPGAGIICGSHPNYYVYASQMIEGMLVCIVMQTKEPISASIDDVKLFSVYSHVDNKFLGSMYALKVDELYFGTFVGSKEVVLCTDDSFKFEKSDKLYIPVPSEEQVDYYLYCNYKKRSDRAIPISLIKKFEDKEDVVHSFTEDISLGDAIKKSIDLVEG